jgi:hypothetical protein
MSDVWVRILKDFGSNSPFGNKLFLWNWMMNKGGVGDFFMDLD